MVESMGRSGAWRCCGAPRSGCRPVAVTDCRLAIIDNRQFAWLVSDALVRPARDVEAWPTGSALSPTSTARRTDCAAEPTTPTGLEPDHYVMVR